MRLDGEMKKKTDRLEKFIADFTATSGIGRLVVGLSGGVDSALSAVLGARALGPENILGLIMPYTASSPESETDARDLADRFGIGIEKIDISPMVDAYFDDDSASALRRGNKMARERMSLLFDIAARDNRLVLGTSNKAEICLGYATWYGDGASSLNPLGGLYKREVWDIARSLDIPDQIVEKKPTADLWPGQTDEEELGLSYELADQLLYKIIEGSVRSIKELQTTGASREIIESVAARINRYWFKRAVVTIDLLDRNPIPKKIELSD